MAVSPRRSRAAASITARPADRSLLPIGITTILPDAAARVRDLERVLLEALGSWGYQEIILPTFEYLDVLSPGLHAQIIEKGYQLTDRTTGRTLVLRPDATAQIARTVAMGMLGDALPLRLSYRTSVFRYEPEHLGRDREQLQIGAELIGLPDVAGDAEIVALLIECLRRLGVKAFRISLGHVGFLQALLRRSGLSPAEQKRAEQAAARKDMAELESIVSRGRVSSRHADAILEAPGLYGGADVLARGRALARGDRAVADAVERLASVYGVLEAGGFREHLLLDLGELRGFDYYDGIVFDVFADGVGYEIGGGGRYDHLIGRYGRTLPSTGFAFDVDRLFRVIESGEHTTLPASVECLLAAPATQLSILMKTAQGLRGRGVCVVQGSPSGADAKSLSATLAEARRLGTRSICWVGLPGLKADEALVVSAADRLATLKVPSIAALRAQGAVVVKQRDAAGILKR